MADSAETYETISPVAASSLPDEYTHAGHVMLYAPQPAKLFGKYDLKYVILVSLSTCCIQGLSYSLLIDAVEV